MEPKHKFNGGLGATLCHNCDKIITEALTLDLYCNNCRQELGYTEEPQQIHKYKLVRQDGLTKVGDKIIWIEWNTNGTFCAAHDDIAEKRSLIIDPHPMTYTWMTTTINEVLEKTEDYIKFKTKNSTYELYISNIENI